MKQENLNNYYIYRYVCPLTNRVRYIGKGKNKRAYDFSSHKYHCGAWIKSIKAQDLLPVVEIMEHDLNGEDAFTREAFWIQFYKEYGEPLTNLTNGFKGTFGYKHTQESKDKMSKAKKGTVVFVHTEETKYKWYLDKLSTCKPVTCVETGITYRSLKEAGRQVGTSATNIRMQLQGKLKTTKGLTFVWN